MENGPTRKFWNWTGENVSSPQVTVTVSGASCGPSGALAGAAGPGVVARRSGGSASALFGAFAPRAFRFGVSSLAASVASALADSGGAGGSADSGGLMGAAFDQSISSAGGGAGAGVGADVAGIAC